MMRTFLQTQTELSKARPCESEHPVFCLSHDRKGKQHLNPDNTVNVKSPGPKCYCKPMFYHYPGAYSAIIFILGANSAEKIDSFLLFYSSESREVYIGSAFMRFRYGAKLSS